MLRARIFSAFKTPQQLALMAEAMAAAQAAAGETGEEISVVTEETILEKNKKLHDRDVNKFCSQNQQYDPTQEFRREDFGFGRAAESNPFLSIMGEPSSPRGTTLREMNLTVTEWNDELPDGATRLSMVEQQKLFSSTASGTIRPIQSFTAHSVNEFKRSTYHLHNCNNPGMMLILIKRIISEELRQMITDIIRHMPARDKFMLCIQDGKVVLEWWKMSMYKLHALLTIIVDNTKTSKELVFVPALDEAVKEAIKFIDSWETTLLRDVAQDPNTTTKIQSNAKRSFNSRALRMNEFIQDKDNSKNLVRKLAMHLKDSIGCDADTRTRNQKVFTIFQAAGVIGRNFPTKPINMGYLDFVDKAIELLEKGEQAFNMTMLFLGESHKKALQMSDVEVGKRLTAYSFKKMKTDPKSETPKGDKTGKGTKRTQEGLPKDSNKKQSSTDTLATQVEAPVDCYECGGQHPAKIVAQWGDSYVCPFEHHKHPHLNTDVSVPFLESKEWKPYKDHPWDQKDPISQKMIPQHRLKMKQMLINGKYVDTLEQALAPSRAEKKDCKGGKGGKEQKKEG